MPKKLDIKEELQNIGLMIAGFEEMLQDPETTALQRQDTERLLAELKKLRQDLLTTCQQQNGKNNFFKKDKDPDDDNSAPARSRSRGFGALGTAMKSTSRG